MKIEFCINKSGELIVGTLVRNQEVEEEIEELTIPSIVKGINVESIADTFRFTFQRLYEHGVRSIHKLIIEDGVEKINAEAFSGINIEINTVCWAKTCKVIPLYCFFNSKIKSIVGIEEVEEIETAAFYGTLLKYFNWPSKCKEIPMECFWKCNRLEQIDGIEEVTDIGYGAFRSSAIKKFLWPEGVSTLEGAEFLIACEKLEEIKFLGNGVRTIDLKCLSLLKGTKKIKVSCCAINLLNTKEYSKIKDRLILPYYVTVVS